MTQPIPFPSVPTSVRAEIREKTAELVWIDGVLHQAVRVTVLEGPYPVSQSIEWHAIRCISRVEDA